MDDLLVREGFKPVRMTENKYCLHPEYLIELLNFIGTMTFQREADTWKELKNKRREQLRAEDAAGYKQTILEEFKHENRMYESVSNEVLAALQLTRQDLNKAETMLLQKPQMFNVVENCRKGDYPIPSQKGSLPKLSQEVTLKQFKRSFTLT